MTFTDSFQIPAFDLESARPDMDAILAELESARAVQIAGHVRPDGDCIGSMLALHHLLSARHVAHALAVRDLPANGYDALEGYDLIRARPDAALNPSHTVYVDCATLDRGFEDQPPSARVLNIDHHAGNTRYGQINWIEPRCAATGEMIYFLARRAAIPVTPALAEALLVAITTDTGAFGFSNTGATQHLIAARLIEAGAAPDRVAGMAFGSLTPEGARLTGRVLNTLRLECEGHLAWSEIRQSTYRQCGGEAMAPENLANQLRTIRGVRFGALFHELADGALRLNLRSDGRVDAARLAAEWGGGGHACAAGAHLPQAEYLPTRDRILARLREAVLASPPG